MTTLFVVPGSFVVSKLDPSRPLPTPVQGTLWSLTVTSDEVSLVCPEPAPADALRSERGWRCLQVEGPLEFSLIGILARLTATLAAANVSVFALSTYDTDYLLVRDSDWPIASDALSLAGYLVDREPR